MEKELTNKKVWMWRYLENTRNYPGLHFTAGKDACTVLAKVLENLSSSGGGRRTVILESLKKLDEARISGGQKFISFSKCRFEVIQPTEQLRFMSAAFANEVVTLRVTPGYLPKFLIGLNDVARGTGDWALHPSGDASLKGQLGQEDQGSLSLWFWPCFGHLDIA